MKVLIIRVSVHRFRSSGPPWCDRMGLCNCFNILWNWVSITTSWHTRSGPGVQRFWATEFALLSGVVCPLCRRQGYLTAISL